MPAFATGLRGRLGEIGRQGVSAQWAASLVCALVSMALSVVLARLMTPSAFGGYAFYLGVGASLGIILDGGFRTLLLRERAAPTPGLGLNGPALAGAMLGHLLLAAPLLAVAALAWAGDWAAPATALCFAVITLTLWYSAWLKGAGELRREAAWQVRCRLLSAATIMTGLWWFGPTATVVLLGWALGLLLAGWLTWPGQRPRLRWPRAPLYRAALGFAGIDLATLIYHRVDIVLLYTLNHDPAEAGRYAAAYRLYDGVMLLSAPLALLVFRRMRQPGSGRSLELAAMGLAMAAGIVLALLGNGFGTFVAAGLFGADFAQADLVGWLFGALIAALPNAVLTYWAIAHHQERFYALAAGLAALFNLAANTWLIPRHGALGAAWSTLGTESLLFALLLGRWGMAHSHTPRAR
ncbi:polysaccharide biosynthesis C-terminal domain-containing protein [Pseudomonas silvicola]|nr:polysaccharide biosynthesis C-terminal domain-containing protein [Pseudomonas silvicola]